MNSTCFWFKELNIFKMSHNKILGVIYPDRDLLLCAADFYFLSPRVVFNSV